MQRLVALVLVYAMTFASKNWRLSMLQEVLVIYFSICLIEIFNFHIFSLCKAGTLSVM